MLMGVTRFTRLFLTAALVALAASPASAAPWAFSFQSDLIHTENHGRASGAADFRDVTQLRLGLGAGQGRSIAANVMLRTRVDGELVLTRRFDLLNEFTLAPQVALERKLGLGPTAPVAAVDVTVTGRLARLREHEGVALRGRAHLSKRWNDWVATAVTGEAQEQWARDRTADLAHQRVQAVLTLDPIDRLRISAGASRRWGQYVANASAGRFSAALAGALGPTVADYYASIPTFTSDAYGNGWIHYRVRGGVDTWWLDLSPALSDRTALAFRYEETRADNVAGVKYRQRSFSVGVLHAF